jgi:TnpA family transposase
MHATLCQENLKRIPFGRSRHRQESIIKPNLKETSCENVDWVYMAHSGVMVMNEIMKQVNRKKAYRLVIRWLTQYVTQMVQC